MSKLLFVEFYKIKKTNIWILLLLSPIVTGLLTYVNATKIPLDSEMMWIHIYMTSSILHGMLFLPLLTGIFTALICRYDHLHGGWKQLLVQPINRYQLYCVKSFLVVLFIIATQFLFLLEVVILGYMCEATGPFPTIFVLKGVIGGFIATLPLIALQMWVSTVWSSFATPMALCVGLTIPAMIISQSERFGPIYPWAQPLLGMIPAGTEKELLFLSTQGLSIIVISLVLLFTGGLIHFMRKAY